MKKQSSMYLVDKRKLLLGVCVHTAGKGWKFLPNNAAHKPSRKFWNCPVNAIPAWAFNASDDLLTLKEWKKTEHERQSSARKTA